MTFAPSSYHGVGKFVKLKIAFMSKTMGTSNVWSRNKKGINTSTLSQPCYSHASISSEDAVARNCPRNYPALDCTMKVSACAITDKVLNQKAHSFPT